MPSTEANNTLHSNVRRCLICGTEQPVVTGRNARKTKPEDFEGAPVHYVQVRMYGSNRGKSAGVITVPGVRICGDCISSTQPKTVRLVRNAVQKLLTNVYSAFLASRYGA